MGKTGITQWVQVKGVKGQIRLVPKSEGELKRPGPNQRFRAGATIKKLEQLSGDQGRPGGRGGRGRGGGRGGRGAGRGRDMGSPAESIVRRAMRRPKVSVMGAKQKSAR